MPLDLQVKYKILEHFFFKLVEVKFLGHSNFKARHSDGSTSSSTHLPLPAPRSSVFVFWGLPTKKQLPKNLYLSGVIHWIFDDLKKWVTSLLTHSNLSWDREGPFIITTEPLLSSPGLKTTSLVTLQEPNFSQILLRQWVSLAPSNRTFFSDRHIL